MVGTCVCYVNEGVVGGGKDASWPKSGDKAEIERPGHAVTPEFH